ncbi:hypothetical protein ILUMI_12575, partial [Ignelater luminosus]
MLDDCKHLMEIVGDTPKVTLCIEYHTALMSLGWGFYLNSSIEILITSWYEEEQARLLKPWKETEEGESNMSQVELEADSGAEDDYIKKALRATQPSTLPYHPSRKLQKLHCLSSPALDERRVLPATLPIQAEQKPRLAVAPFDDSTILNAASINAFVVYNSNNYGSPIKRREFIKKLALSLLLPYLKTKQLNPKLPVSRKRRICELTGISVDAVDKKN